MLLKYMINIMTLLIKLFSICDNPAHYKHVAIGIATKKQVNSQPEPACGFIIAHADILRSSTGSSCNFYILLPIWLKFCMMIAEVNI